MPSTEQMMATLLDMGFSNNRAVRALRATGFKGTEPAVEWLFERADDPSLDEDFTEEEGAQIQQEIEKPQEEKKPLTAEEKAEKLAKLEELRVKKRAEREAKEKEEAKAKEKSRIESGKDMGEIRQALAEQEIKKLAALRRQEKEDDKKAKARVLAQIEADKAARKAERESAAGKKPDSAPVAAPAAAAAPAPKKDYTETRVQVRLPSGAPLVHAFGVKEPLSAVRLFVQMNRTDGGTGEVKLMTNFPKKVFGDEDYDNTLENLGLVPSAVLIVTK
jgi:hypothetical protein